MKIAIFGTGYVGLVSGVCLAEIGHEVVCVDIDKSKIEKLRNGIPTIHENGLNKLLSKNIKSESISFTDDASFSVKKSKVIFVAVGTPENKDGTANMAFVENVSKTIGKNINGYKVIINKSTMPVGSAKNVNKIIKKEIKKRQMELDFDVVSNPEFLKEGKAIDDFMYPDRIVIGASSSRAKKIMRDLYKPLISNDTSKLIIMSNKSAEMTKYAANAMLATKISFINEMSRICENVGANINDVRLGIGTDERIGFKFIHPGVGYGGSCFPKDVKALAKIAENNNYKSLLIDAVDKINKNQKINFLNRILKKTDKVKSKIVTIWGLAFKPDTDDVREAPSIYIIKGLIKRGVLVQCHDPIAIPNFKKELSKKELKSVIFYDKPYKALDNSSMLILLTEWNEYKQLKLKLMSDIMKNKIVFDGRNIYDRIRLERRDFEYYEVGV
tara:strand:- start:114 stop:1439 length:1326 start_codon:yes stop_codon:yes gene_type:complete